MKNHLGAKVKRLQAALSPFIKWSPTRNQSGGNTHSHGPVNSIHGNSEQRVEETREEEGREEGTEGDRRGELSTGIRLSLLPSCRCNAFSVMRICTSDSEPK